MTLSNTQLAHSLRIQYIVICLYSEFILDFCVFSLSLCFYVNIFCVISSIHSWYVSMLCSHCTFLVYILYTGPIPFQPLPLPRSPSPLFCALMFRCRGVPIRVEIGAQGEEFKQKFFRCTLPMEVYEICCVNHWQDCCGSDKAT